MTEGYNRREFLAAAMGFSAAESLEAAAKKRSAPEKPHHKTPLELQHEQAKADGLSYLQNEEELKDMVHNHLLVELPHDHHITFDPYLSAEGKFKKGNTEYRKYKRNYCRPWTKDFLNDLAQDYFKKFPQASHPLVVTSAVRPVDVQNYIINEGLSKTAVAKSVHPTGATVDLAYGQVTKKKLDGTVKTQQIKVNGKPQWVAEIAYPGIPLKQKEWLYEQLNKLEKQKLLLVRTEKGEPVFHFIVAKKYSEWRKTNR
jgi:hypothetical protein